MENSVETLRVDYPTGLIVTIISANCPDLPSMEEIREILGKSKITEGEQMKPDKGVFVPNGYTPEVNRGVFAVITIEDGKIFFPAKFPAELHVSRRVRSHGKFDAHYSLEGKVMRHRKELKNKKRLESARLRERFEQPDFDSEQDVPVKKVPKRVKIVKPLGTPIS